MMPSNNQDFEGRVHAFHLAYRNAGIALCVSLAAVSGSEAWWLFRQPQAMYAVGMGCRSMLWWPTLISAIGVFLATFVIQFFHYCGMKALAWQARDAYAGQVSSWAGQAGQELAKTAKQWKAESDANFTRADDLINVVGWLALANAVMFFLYARP